MKILSYSKINYTLEVGNLRADRYHSLSSIVQTISLADVITIEPNNSGRITLETNVPHIPTDSSNTVMRAVSLFLGDNNIDKGMDIYIEKNVPSQAGLGGGSANASYTLSALNELFETGKSQSYLADLSAKIGSDCPLFIYGGSVFMSGRGEIIEKLPPLPQYYYIIIKPDFSVSTKEAYKCLDQRKTVNHKHFTEKIIKLQRENSLSSDILPQYLTNDFEIQCYDIISPIKSHLLNVGAEGALLCGSGSCVFGMFSDKRKRDTALQSLHQYKTYTAESI